MCEPGWSQLFCVGRQEASPDEAEQKGEPELEHVICLAAEKMSGLGWMWVNGARPCFVR